LHCLVVWEAMEQDFVRRLHRVVSALATRSTALSTHDHSFTLLLRFNPGALKRIEDGVESVGGGDRDKEADVDDAGGEVAPEEGSF
jgi:hypothetical protein